jgi:hypothetical protein
MDSVGESTIVHRACRLNTRNTLWRGRGDGVAYSRSSRQEQERADSNKSCNCWCIDFRASLSEEIDDRVHPIARNL